MNSQQLLQQAFQYLHLGNLLAAAPIFEAVLQQEPLNFAALNGRGFIALQQNRLPQSADDFEQSLTVNPKQAFAQKMLGIVLGAMGRFDESMQAFAAALELDSKDPEVYFNRANFRFQAGQALEALSDLDAAIKLRGSYLEARSNRANLLIQIGDFVRAEKDLDYLVTKVTNSPDIWVALGLAKHKVAKHRESMQCNERALRLLPNHPDALLNISSVAYDQGDYDAALLWAEKAVLVTPNRAKAHYVVAQALRGLGRFEEAIKFYRSTLNIDPVYLDAYNGLGLINLTMLQYKDSLIDFDKVLTLDPDNVEAQINKGVALRDLGDLDGADRLFTSALHLNKSNIKALNNIGLLAMAMRVPERALRAWELGLEQSPGDPSLSFSQSTSLLKLGRYFEGWRAYESRNLKRGSPRKFEVPLWLGEFDISRSTVLVHAEQGLGDTLQFCRYVDMISDKCEQVLLLVQKPLKAICGTLKSNPLIFTEEDVLPKFDAHVPMMSLPLAFGTDVDNIPSDIPYLYSEQSKLEFWRCQLKYCSGLKVGVVWNGGFRPEDPNIWAVNNRRNIQIECIKHLFIEGVQLVSLQKGEPAVSELKRMVNEKNVFKSILDFSDQLSDFTDTAALIENLDLVISVDTSVAHLAGALGKPVWILNRFDGCWRWFMDRSDSPWYPTAKIYNQKRPGDWVSVMERIRLDLLELMSELRG